MATGSIIKREGVKGVSWLLKYELPRDPITKERRTETRTVRGGTKADAQRELRRILKGLDDGTHAAKHKLSFEGWAEKWLARMDAKVQEGRLRLRTFEEYGNKLAYATDKLGAIELQKLTAEQIEGLYSELLTAGRKPRGKDGKPDSENPGLSAQTVLHVHRVLFQCLKAATRQRMIPRNPCEDVDPPSPKRARSKLGQKDGGEADRALDRDQNPKLLAAFKGHPLYVMVALGLGTGLRRGELLGLRWSDIDFEKKRLSVNRAVSRTSLRGVEIGDPKNESSRRTLGIGDGLCDLLREHRVEQKALALKLGQSYPVDCLIFPLLIKRNRGRQPLQPKISDVDFNRPQDPETVTKAFRDRAIRSGFPNLWLHDLRHSHATQLLLEGVPVHVVADRLGHSTPVVTMTIYAHVLKRAEDKAAQVAGDLLQAALVG